MADHVDLMDEEIDRWIASVPCARYEPADMQRMAREIKRHRATMNRIAELALSLEHGLRPEQREIGAELRNRMKGG